MVCKDILIGEIRITLYCHVKAVLIVVWFLEDTFQLFQIVNGVNKQVPLDGKGIAWWSDYNIKFRNPSVTPLKNAFNGSNFDSVYCNLHLLYL